MLIIYVVAFIAIFYFMAIRPQQRQRKAHQALLSSLKKGDRIITAAGIYGTVKRVEESIVVVEVAKGMAIKIARRSVAEIIRDQATAQAAAPEAIDRAKAKAAQAELEESNGIDPDATDSVSEDGNDAPLVGEVLEDSPDVTSRGSSQSS